ncbi:MULTISPECIES: amidase domain-containing protein [unclassified Streptomyces]|uniref:amidase domain-containing protein n=1 Tax=unclassified Streptomyces TaxID=2593676 RepID=UPI002E802A09|nr:amidase domain-containing protein [Streptomyces sp. NBC_00589]WTI33782.1 amidase domain-containing protein [Streptomyces sp. NBC_00775]WUB32545.1 amidase domain-containing protein [Streptomyces sp. NBC_00589]
MRTRKLSRKRRRATIVTAAAASVVAGAALLPNWSAGAASVAGDVRVDPSTRATFQKLADAVFTDRTDMLVDSGKTRQNTSLASRFSGDVRLSSALSREENSALSQLQGRKSRLASLGEKYSSANTSVALDRTRVKGRHATVDVTETTTLTYQKVQGNEPKTTGFQAHHKLTFKADRNGDWQLTGIRDTDDGVAVNQVATTTFVAAPNTADDGNPPAAARSATTWPAAAKPKSFSATGYDYKAMAAYAAKYWKNYNPAYPDFNGQGAGGDCTNFVSQSLKAGGWKHVPGYTYDFHKWFGNSDIQSDSFVGVNEFSWFALSSKRVASLANVYQLDVGDVLQMDFNKDGSKDHTMIVTYRSPQGVPYVTYHSTNTYNRSVASIVASYPNAAYYAYRT